MRILGTIIPFIGFRKYNISIKQYLASMDEYIEMYPETEETLEPYKKTAETCDRFLSETFEVEWFGYGLSWVINQTFLRYAEGDK